MSILNLNSKEREELKKRCLRIQSRSEDEHNQHTPLELCEEIVEKLVESDADFSGNILIISTVEFIPVILQVLTDKGLSKDKVWFSSWNEYKRNFAKTSGINTLGHLLDQEIDMKFDVIIGNPPYKKNLHLDIVKKSFNLLSNDGKLIFVHPASWLYVQKPGKTLNTSIELKKIINNKFKKIEIINGNFEFNIRLFGPCSITIIDNSKETNEVLVENKMNNSSTIFSNIFEINPFFDDEKVFNSIKTKIWKYCSVVDNFQNHIYSTNGDFFVNLENMIGDANQDSPMLCVDRCTYQFIYDSNAKVLKNFVKTNSGSKQYISFNTEEEANNFLNFIITSKIAMFSLMIVKIGIHLSSGRPLRFIPFFNFDKSLSDIEIKKILNLTNIEYNFIIKHVDEFNDAWKIIDEKRKAK